MIRLMLRRHLLPSWRHRKRTLRRQAWAVVLLAYPVLAFAWLLPQDFTAESRVYIALAWAAFMVLTFAFHLGLGLAVIGAVAAWRRRWGLALAAAPPMLLAIAPVAWRAIPERYPLTEGPPLTVMSANLLMINQETDAVIEQIRAVEPDVLLLQEYTEHWRAALEGALVEAYPYRIGAPRSDSFGMAIYSDRPFVEAELYLPMGPVRLPTMRAVVELGGREVAIYNIHLLPPHRIRYVADRRAQFADLLGLLADEPLPMIVAGDFNFTPASAYAEALRDLGLRDAHDLAAWGRGATWPAHPVFRYLPVPGLRLDQIYLSERLTALDARTGAPAGSDHRPIIAAVAFRESEAERVGPPGHKNPTTHPHAEAPQGTQR